MLFMFVWMLFVHVYMYVCYICYVMNIYLFRGFFSLWVYHIWEYYRKCFSFSDDDTITRHGRFRKDEEEVRYEWLMRFPDTWKHSCFKGNKNIYITTIKKKNVMGDIYLCMYVIYVCVLCMYVFMYLFIFLCIYLCYVCMYVCYLLIYVCMYVIYVIYVI